MIALTQKVHSREEIYYWLNEQAQKMGIQAFFWMRQAEMRGEWLHIAVYIESDLNAYEEASKLQQMQEAWNYQEPEPLPRVFLLPSSKKPASLEACRPTREALDWQDAVKLVLSAHNPVELEVALAELRAAKEAEFEAHQELDLAA